MLDIVGFSGSPSRPSKTRTLVQATTDALAAMGPARTRVFDLGDLGPSLAVATQVGDLDRNARALIERLERADILVVGSPIYKASYSGLFKHLFDILSPEALREKLVCLTATGGSHRHALAIEQHMRPLFAFFCAITLPTVIFATAADFVDDAVGSDNVLERIHMAAGEAHRLTAARRLPEDATRSSMVQIFGTADAAR